MEFVDKKLTNEVGLIFNKWSIKYRAYFHRGEPYTCVAQNKSFLKDQIEFVRLYLGYMLIDGVPLKRIKQFLSMQSAVNNDAKMEIHFCGCNPPEVKVAVDDLSEIDVADIFGLTDFTYILVCKGKNKRWTTKSAKAFIEVLNDDLAFDGFEGKFDYEFSKHQLEVECRIE